MLRSQAMLCHICRSCKFDKAISSSYKKTRGGINSLFHCKLTLKDKGLCIPTTVCMKSDVSDITIRTFISWDMFMVIYTHLSHVNSS